MDNKDKKVILGMRIMQKRKHMGMTQSQLAEAVDLSDHQISNIENGKSYPRMSSFIKICEEFDMNSDYFIAGIIKKDIQENIIDMIASCTIEEQKTIWKLLDAYIHRKDDTRI